MSELPFVAPADAVTEPWWEATRRRLLLLQTCVRCAAVQHPPGTVCRTCGGLDLGWRETSGGGVVDAYTVVHRAPLPGFDPPYVVARVRLDEGPVLLTNLLGDLGDVRCDDRVELAWRPVGDGRHLPVFTPTRT